MKDELVQKVRVNTFSKYVMSIIVSLYLIGAIIGAVLVIVSAIVDVEHGVAIDPSMFMAYAAYLGAPTATAIIFYAWKDKAENVIKIAQSFKLEQAEQAEQFEQTGQFVEVMDILSKMGGN